MSDTPSWGLVFIRIVVGFLLLAAGFENLRAGDGESIVAHASKARQHEAQELRIAIRCCAGKDLARQGTQGVAALGTRV